MSALSDALANPDHKVRLLALKAALDGQDRAAPDPIVAALPNESNPKVRNAMALVIGRLGQRGHAPALARLLRDPDAGVRMRAVEGIAALKGSASYPALVAMLVAETDAKVRDFCAHHLLRLGGDKLMTLFQHMLGTDVGWMKEAAVLALALFNSPRVVPLLRAVHQKETGPLKELAFKGLERLAGMGNDGATRAVAELTALREPPRLDVDFANLDDDTSDQLGFEDTYTGGKLPRIEIGSPLDEEDAEDVSDAPPIAAPPAPPSPLVAMETPVTVQVQPVAAAPLAEREPADEPRARRPLATSSPSVDLFPAEPPAPSMPTAPPPPVRAGSSSDALAGAEPEKAKGSGRRPRPVVNPANAPAAATPPPFERPAGNFEGGMGNPRRPGEDAMRPCPACGAEISAGARRCRHCSEVFTDEPPPSMSSGAQIPFDLAFVAVLSMLLGAVEAFHQFTAGMNNDAALGAVMGVLHLVEIVAAIASFRGLAWGWYLWWPLAFFLFVVGASHGDAIAAGRSFACLISLSRTPTREFCIR